MKKLLLSIVLLASLSSVAVAQLNTDRILNMGRNALYFEDYVLSIQYFNLVINAKPYLADPLYYRAISKYYLEDNTGAIEDCDRALNIDPFLIGAYELRGICYQRMEQYDMAVNDFAKGLKYDHKNTNLMLNLGVSYMASGKPEKAVEQFDKAIDEKGSFMAAYLSRGAANLEMGDTIQGLQDYTRAIEINPYYTASYMRRGYLYILQGEFEKARADYDMSIRLDPENANLYLARGVVRYHLNDLMGAIDDYDKAVNLDRNNSSAYYNRAMLRGYIGDNNRAIDDYTIVLQLEPDNNFARLNRALLLLEIGSYYAAINDLSTIINEYPQFPVAYYARAEAKEAMGDKEGAQKDYGTAYVLQQDSKDKKKKKADLDKSIKNKEGDDKGTRDKDDKNIKSYKRIVFTDEEDEESEYDSEIRGKVQNQNVDVSLEGDFYYSYYQQSDILNRTAYYQKALDEYNRSGKDQSLYLTNQNMAFSKNQINTEFIAIDALSSGLETQENAYMYFSRAMHYSLVKNFADALQDLNKALDISPDDILMLFARASVRQRMVEFIRSIESKEVLDNVMNDEKAETMSDQKTNRIIDYDLIVADYNRVLDLVPTFSYAWYNKGNVMTVLKNYKAAISDYSKAIECDPELAEAYYNRGLNYIYLGDNEKGLKDLSKAGELGLYKAYNVMKRYGK